MANKMSDYFVKIPSEPSLQQLSELLVKLGSMYPYARTEYAKVSAELSVEKVKYKLKYADLYTKTESKTVNDKKYEVEKTLTEEALVISKLEDTNIKWESVVSSMEEQINIVKKLIASIELEYKKSGIVQ